MKAAKPDLATVARRLQSALANTVRRAFKVREHPVDDTSHNIPRWAVEDALIRKRLQCERNAAALAGLDTCFMQSTTQGKAHTLAEIVNRITQHADSDGHVVIKGVQGVVGELSFHSSSRV